MSDVSQHDEVLAGNEARYILEHKQFNRALQAVRDSVIAQMRQVKPRDVEMHSELIRRLQTADAIERALRETIRTGDLAKAEIKHKQTLGDRAKAQLDRVFSRN